MVHGMNGGAVICTACGVEVERLALFPGNICLECHAAKHEADTPADMLRDILGAFGGR